ncbi:MAG: ABC transporter ATP-binding protein [Calditrichaeota bacterium]|nr:ABC transporter ATP-binding protein [Calditrichota bacterium]MCB0285770.1 ABC transporter ATP-binding protein [Calditrichota bacterium]MCB0301753.1 ABC transporter ATP-binding protein [Calditrichota bacterium]
MSAIEITNFSKSFGETRAVKNVSLSVKPGELFGLIGPDGAGKTTLMRAICTLLLPDDGQIQVRGMNTREAIADIRAILGYMPQRFSLYQDLSVEQNLRFFADLFNVPAEERAARMKRLYQFSRLGNFNKRLAGQLSGGMKQKLALSCALIHTPEILVLDEPTFGVDPVSRQEFWEILHEIRKEGTTILVSTAYMDEADQCERVALMFNGEFAAIGSPKSLKSNYRYPLYRLDGKNLRELRAFFEEKTTVYATQMFGDALHVSFAENPADAEWQRWQSETGGNLSGWHTEKPSIEDVFLDLINQQNLTKSAAI